MFRKAFFNSNFLASLLVMIMMLIFGPAQLLAVQGGDPAEDIGNESPVTNGNYLTSLQQSTSEMLKREVELKPGKHTVGHVLRTVADQLDLKLSFSSEVVPMEHEITINDKRKTAKSLLWNALGDLHLRFALSSSGQLVITKNTEQTNNQTVATATVSGKVVEASTGKSLPGANVYIKKNRKGSTTNTEGKFTINGVEAGTHILIASFIGFQKAKKEITVKENEELNIVFQLKSSTNALDEMVVVGYGSTTKDDLTGSIGSIDNEELLAKPTDDSFDQLLGGKMAGVKVSQISGKSGMGAILNIRGAASITGDNQPLYVVDGTPVQASQQVPKGFNGSAGAVQSANPLLSINPQNIKSVDVLKDASAAAIYGSRAANGVVIITTKRGQGMKAPTLEFGYNVSVERFVNKYDLMNADQYQDYATTIAENTLDTDPTNTNAQQIVNNKRTNGDPYFGSGQTDWADEITRSAGVSHDFNLSYGAGNDATNYFVSLNTKLNKGLFKRDEFNSYNIRANIDSDPKDWLSLNASLSYNYNSDKSGNATNFSSAFFFQPTYNTYDGAGDYTRLVSNTGNESYNPVARNKEISNSQIGNNVVGSTGATLEVIDGLELKSQFNFTLLNTNIDNYQSNLFQIFQSTLRGRRTLIDTKKKNIFWDNTLSFNRQLGQKHTIDAVMGASFEQRELSTKSIYANGFSNDEANAISAAERIERRIQDRQEGVLHSYFARFNYDYDKKYYLTLTGRADGSSKFGPDNRWGLFPSGALAWRVTEEPFLKNNETLTFLKIRTSYGETGLANLPEFQFRRLYSSTDDVFGNSFYNGTPGLISNGIPNSAIQWETNKQFDAAVEFRLFNDRIDGEVNYYNNVSSGLILNSSISPSSGYAKQSKNVGDISNEGWEFELGADVLQTSDFNWHSSFNISFNENKLKDLNGGTLFDFGNPGSIVEGEPLGNIYGYKVEGFFQSQDEIDDLNASSPGFSYQSAASSKVGNYKYKDTDGDGQITPDDQVSLGNTQPDYYGGWNNRFTYQNISLVFNFQYSQGVDKVWGDQNKYLTSYAIDKNNFVGALEDTWTTNNRDARYQRAYMGTFKGTESTRTNSRQVYDASYIRLKVLRVNYNLPTSLLQGTPMSNVRIYGVATNLWTMSDWPGLDPELVTSDNEGLNTYNTTKILDGYPLTRTFTLGINISF